ncbi:hypothetical protein [Escherichia coli]|uniref:hypothetical protein n=1 Tax=Escherichia coli TaxID=562 RepID=UPI00390810E7
MAFYLPWLFIFDVTNRTGVGGVKIAEAFPEGRGSPHGCGLRARLTGRYLAPDPVAEGDKLKVPRSGDFVRQSPGAAGAATGRPPARSLRQWLYMALHMKGAQQC